MPDRVHKLSSFVKHPAGSKKLPGVGSSIKLARTTGLWGSNSRLVSTVADEAQRDGLTAPKRAGTAKSHLARGC